MATVVLDVYSKPFPLITNRIRASVYEESDPQALVDFIIDTSTGHPTRLWHFPGLPRTNYKFLLEEINTSDVVVSVLADFDVVPGIIEGALARDDEQVKVGTTPGFVAGTNTFTFDGTGGKPDYVGWSIVPSELNGRGILIYGLDYTWNSSNGTFVLLQAGDQFQTGTTYNIHFDNQSSAMGNSSPTIFDFQVLYTNNDITLGSDDFSKKLVCEPTGLHITVHLPSIVSIPAGRRLFIDVAFTGLTPRCVKILPNGTDVINFRNGQLWMMSGEVLSIYRVRRPDNTNFWQITDYAGNFLNLGEIVGEDSSTNNVFNKKLMDGSREQVIQYERIYNDYVLKMPGGYVVNYDDWGTGTNKTHFSYANSANPTNAGWFHFPDRRDLYEVFTLLAYAGTYVPQSIQFHDHEILGDNTGASGGSMKSLNIAGVGVTGAQRGNGYLLTNGSAQKLIRESGTNFTRPNSYTVNKYILV